MLRFLGFVVLLASVFALGYYSGQRPISELRKTLQELTKNVLDATLGMERNVKVRQGLIDAKASITQAKAELLDRNFGNAAKELGQAITHLEQVGTAELGDGEASRLRPLVAKAREAQQKLSLGKALPRAKLDELEKELSGLLAP